MELLTGKAKEAFYKWLKIQNDLSIGFHIPNSMGGIVYHINSNTELLPKRILTPLIIDFFDSVKLYIEPIREAISADFGYILHEGHHENDLIDAIQGFETRQEATIAGIKKANEIFNSKF